MDTVKLAVPMNVSRKITLKFTDAQRAVMFNTSAGIPNDAMLFDNGATLNCIKTDAGRLVGSFIENADGDISVGDESSSLASNGSYLHALTFTDADGKKIDTLYRFDDTRNAICNIFSEPSEVYENGGSFSFNNGGRVWTTTDNCSMRLHMTPNHLAWAKVTPIQDKSTIRALLERSKHNLTVSIPRRIATPSRKLVTIVDGALDTGVAVERTVEETTAEIDAIAISINMMPLVDPTFTGFIPGEPMFEGESVTAACKRQPTVVSSSTSPFFTVQPPCDKDLNYIMDDLYKEHKWGSIDSDDSNGDYDDMPECINDNSASSGDDEHTARHSIARKKKLVLQVSGAKQVCISSAGDDNESMGKLFVSNLKTATSKLSESTNTYALRLAENAAELKIAMLRTCTKYAKYLDESTACNAEPRIEHLMEQINLATDGNAATYVANAFNAKKAKYTALQWQDMADQRLAWLKKTRLRDYVTIANKCCDAHASATPSAASPPNSTKVTPLCTDNVAAAKLLLTATGPTKCCNVVTHLLTKDCDAATKHAILSMVKAPPTTIGMGRPVALTGLEILWRLHVVLGHASIDQVMATLSSKTENMRAGIVTKSDVEAFVKLGCAQCILWKMRRAPAKSLVDATLAPPGKKWSYDTLTPLSDHHKGARESRSNGTEDIGHKVTRLT